MKYLDDRQARPLLGLAYGPGIPEFLDLRPGAIDYVEVPFEQLKHTPALFALQDTVALVLHCASLSVAGFVPPLESTIDEVADVVARTRTPWIGEHLAFVSAEALAEDEEPVAGVTSLTYTVCPQLSEETIERVLENLAALRPRLAAPLILENSPQYFFVPGSTMNMVDFVGAIASRCDAGLLLDLSHFAIAALNTGGDPMTEIDRLPLERVVEIHISGFSRDSGIVWDDHASPAPQLLFDLLSRVLTRAHPRALTLEYNWSAAFPEEILLSHLDRARRMLDCA